MVIAGGVVGGVVLNNRSDESAPADSSASGEDGGSVPFGAAQPPSADPDTDADDLIPAPVEPTGPSSTAVPAPVTGDLDLGVPMSSPACDGSWMVFLGAATEPTTYAADVRALMSSQPGTMYTLTKGGCSSMRQELPDGSLIYAVSTSARSPTRPPRAPPVRPPAAAPT